MPILIPFCTFNVYTALLQAIGRKWLENPANEYKQVLHMQKEATAFAQYFQNLFNFQSKEEIELMDYDGY